MWKDPIVQETRKLRKEYAVKFEGNSEAMFQDILKRQARHKERLVSFQPRKPGLHKKVA
ncbi:MAG: hypothetical protein JJV89_01615 [Desulfosarcina sp.]|nr:hypothetical protein [Desulfobacterales bacterium]